jgi:hypothetical protein
LKANPPPRRRRQKPALPIDPLPKPPGYDAYHRPSDLPTQLAAGEYYDDARKALARLKKAGCDEAELLDHCWVAACGHEENFRLSKSARRIGDSHNFYGQEPKVLRALPEKLRKLATTIDKVNAAPSMRHAFINSVDLTDSTVTRIVSIPNTLRQYADALEKAYKWAARNLAGEYFNPSSRFEWILAYFVRETTGRRKRTPWGDIAELLGAIVDIRLGDDRAKYKTTIDGENLRRRFARYSKPKVYRRMVADVTDIEMALGWPSQRLSEARALERKILERFRILGIPPADPARRRRFRDR